MKRNSPFSKAVIPFPSRCVFAHRLETGADKWGIAVIGAMKAIYAQVSAINA